MILSDHSIGGALAAGRISIDPIGEDAIQPASLDIRLDRQFRVFRAHRRAYIDVRESVDDLTAVEEVADDAPFVLHPGEFVLGSTLERVRRRPRSLPVVSFVLVAVVAAAIAPLLAVPVVAIALVDLARGWWRTGHGFRRTLAGVER